MVAPPAVVVTTPTRGGRAPTGRIGVRRTSGSASISASRLSTRAMPQSARNALGDVVLAGERAGVRDGELARGRRAAELVGDDRLAACGRAERKVAQRVGVAHAFPGTAGSRRCRGRRGSRRRSRRARDRPRCRSTRGRRSRCRAPCRATSARRSWCRSARRRRCARSECPARQTPRWRSASGPRAG